MIRLLYWQCKIFFAWRSFKYR